MWPSSPALTWASRPRWSRACRTASASAGSSPARRARSRSFSSDQQGMPMSRYVFQDAFERFIAALDDALLLDLEAGRVNYRRYSGGLVKESRAMYRAIAVTSVAAWEDFNEQLLGTGYLYLKKTAAIPPPDELRDWFPPERLQAPNSNNVRKLYWAYFGLDPMPSWWFSFAATAREIGLDDNARFSFNDPVHREERTRSGPDAARWLDALVQLRHAAAHRDPRPYRRVPELGVAT